MLKRVEHRRENRNDTWCAGPRYAAVPNRTFQTIDGMTSHSWYLEDSIWYDDLAYTLKGQLDRNLIPTRTRVGENDFALKISL
jgi:hypothetical protein